MEPQFGALEILVILLMFGSAITVVGLGALLLGKGVRGVRKFHQAGVERVRSDQRWQ